MKCWEGQREKKCNASQLCLKSSAEPKGGGTVASCVDWPGFAPSTCANLTGYRRSDLVPRLWKPSPFDMRGKKEKMRKERKVWKKRRQRKWWLDMKVWTDISLARKIKGLWTKFKKIIIIVDYMPRDNVDRRWETADNIPEFLCSFSSFMNVLVILQV